MIENINMAFEQKIFDDRIYTYADYTNQPKHQCVELIDGVIYVKYEFEEGKNYRVEFTKIRLKAGWSLEVLFTSSGLTKAELTQATIEFIEELR